MLRNFPDCSVSNDPTKEITPASSVLGFLITLKLN